MEMVLAGETISATDAERFGLVNRVVPVELLLEEAKNLAKKIAAKPRSRRQGGQRSGTQVRQTPTSTKAWSLNASHFICCSPQRTAKKG